MDKYEVLRHGEPVDDCFILRYDRDSHALPALAAYAASVREENPELSDDLWRIVRVHSGQLFAPTSNQEHPPASRQDV